MRTTTKKIIENRRLPVFLSVVFFLLSLNGAIALAAPPSNDTFVGAAAVGIGFSENIDTTEATTDADDSQLNASCGAPVTDASVWYAITPNTDGTIVVDVSQSHYSAGVVVGVGSQGNLQNISCGASAVSFFATADTTYYVLAIDYQGDGGGNGGALNISFNQAPPAPTVDDLTINKFGSVNTKTGVATISGSYTCSHGDFIDLFGEARQQVGRVTTIRGFYDVVSSGTCDGLPHPWSADVFPQSGKFAGGKSMAVTVGFSCGPYECTNGFAERTVQLRSNSK